jgi:NAD(P)-dependent dehydrogenase (short-subunit alcohol dehydrogenase family)
MTLFDMSGKVAVITGSSRGIGRAIAERMAEHGAKVVISSRKQQVCDEVAKAINDKAGKQVALAIAANISTKDDLKHLVEETNRVFGKIDTLVCNAASNPYYGPQAGISDDQFRKILDNNIVANHWLISLVVPQMIERKDGSITVISSIGGLKGSTVLGAYAISKAADMQLARNLACTLAAIAHRRARRDRRRRGVSGVRGGDVHDRTNHRHRRRCDDQLSARSSFRGSPQG